ncbi:MAG: DUF1353 domain-containing protein [Desulfuromonadaceae bacterium]
MKGDVIHYKKGYKYQLHRNYTVLVGIDPGCEIITDWLHLQNGYLTISKGYAWDGPSGPTFDTSDSLRGSLVHDALYQLMRLGLISESYRGKADDLLHEICVEDGMVHIRAEMWKQMVICFAAGAARSGSEQPVLIAPCPEEKNPRQWNTETSWIQTVGGP